MKKKIRRQMSAMDTISASTPKIDADLRREFVAHRPGLAAPVYEMLEYFMGFREADLKPRTKSVGKRFRPALTAYIASAYRTTKSSSAALSIELFHNFTLIHDDIVDRDEKRRGRPTVWKLFGTDHAINSGDVQLIMASRLCLRAESSARGTGDMLFAAFIKVCEGQYLDFEMAKQPLNAITEKQYVEMIRRKTAALVAASAEAAGLAARKNATERKRLRSYGENLGLAYQIADDYRSVWSAEEDTGKDSLGDIREKKRALPVILAFASLTLQDRSRLDALYGREDQLTDAEAREVKALFDVTDVRDALRKQVLRYAGLAKRAADTLAIPQSAKTVLMGVVDELTSLT